MEQRSIKFRAWDEDKKEMFRVGSLRYHDVADYLATDDWYGKDFWAPGSHRSRTIMQFTGLKDKNGTEIYEGDIVKTGDLVGPVSFGRGVYEVAWRGYLSSSFNKRLCVHDTRSLEVIGNVYEHPELLSETAA